jgi:CubicO group peptidase (beta-lactamase class C family)
VLIERDRERLSELVLGYRQLETGRQFSRDSVFRLYSMTKPITSIAVMMLFDKGNLKLDDVVGDYLASYAHSNVCASGDDDETISRPA